MIDIENEELLPVKDVPKWCEKLMGKRISPATVTRWRTRGARNAKLDTILMGGSRYTSVEALHEFFHSSTRNGDGETARPPRSVIRPAANRNAADAARSSLSNDGIPTPSSR